MGKNDLGEEQLLWFRHAPQNNGKLRLVCSEKSQKKWSTRVWCC
jgi:hypothetical protein